MAAVSENGQKALFTLNGTDLVNIISYGVTANSKCLCLIITDMCHNSKKSSFFVEI